jgi:cobalt-zinc-cadmium efflux system outer membrane protein
MQRTWMSLLIVLGLLLPAIVRADESVVTLKELEQEALQNNPEIRMVDKKAESADEKRSLAAAMPDPMIGYMVQNVGSPATWTVGQYDMSMQGLVFSQEVPFPGKLSTMGHAAGKMAEREHENAREKRLRVLAELRNAYYDYYLAFRSTEIITRTKDLMKKVQLIAETRYGTGQGMQQDVLRAQIEVMMLLDKLAEEERRTETQTAMINRLVGRDPLAPLGRPAELPPISLDKSIEDLAAMAQAHSPLLEAKQLMVEQSEFEVSSQKKEFLPNIVLSGGWFTRDARRDVWQASVMLKVPLYFWNKSTGVRAAKAELHSARYDYTTTQLTLLARVRELYAMARTSEHHLTLYKTGIIPEATQALQSTTSNYRVGKTDFLTLLDSQELLLKYQLMEQEELANLHKTLSLIGELTGEDLQ